MRRPASLDPTSKTYIRLARRIALRSLNEAVRALKISGDFADIREAGYLVSGVVQRMNAKRRGL